MSDHTITTLNWLLFLHIASVLALLGTHGASMAVLYGIRKERDRARIMAMVQLSGRTTVPMYVSILLIVLFGSLLAFKFHMWGEKWLWVSIAILVVTIGLMTAMAQAVLRQGEGSVSASPFRRAADLRRGARRRADLADART